MQDSADAVPQTILTPALIAAVGGMPGAVGCRHLAPRDPGAHNPEQALEQTAVLESGTATCRLLRGQEGDNLLPEGVAQRCGSGEHERERRVRGAEQRLARRTLGNMVPTGAGLMASPPVRPL